MSSERIADELDKRMYRILKYGEDKYQSERERKHQIAHNDQFWETFIDETLKHKRQ